MTRIEEQVFEIKDNVSKMMALVGTQIERSRSVVFDFNKDLVEEISASEKTVNSLDLKIDSDCEKTLALLSPVADDLRLILSVLKINTYLERMGDNAQSIAKSIHDFETAPSEEDLKTIGVDLLYSQCIEMLNIASEAFNEEDTTMASKVFKMDKQIDKINNSGLDVVSALIRKNIDNTENYLRILGIVRKLERIGDLTKNIAEETIFYVDAKVLRHKKKKLKKFEESHNISSED